MLKKLAAHIKRYNPYSMYAAKSELKGEVGSSYLTWLWWILDPVSLYARIRVYHCRGVPVTGRISAGCRDHRPNGVELLSTRR